jgi:protein-S-isoprenylcysteine O-methyltransferase Ste14
METNTSHDHLYGKPETTGLIVKRFLQISISILTQAAILFLASGRLNWGVAWVYIGVNIGIVAFNAWLLLPKNPELIAERARIKENVKGWDKVLASLASVIGPIIMLLIAGLDGRFGWSPSLPLTIQFIALVLLVVGYGIVSWAMASNKFFSSMVRIQTDRGHTVATAGPYQYVRHPGYVGMIIFSLTTPVLLGSLWGLIPAGFTVGMFVIRTALEDKTLQNELNGYKEYTQRVRYRLMPGIW